MEPPMESFPFSGEADSHSQRVFLPVLHSVFPAEEGNPSFCLRCSFGLDYTLPLLSSNPPQLFPVPGVAKGTLLQEALLDLQAMLLLSPWEQLSHTTGLGWGQAPLASATPQPAPVTAQPLCGELQSQNLSSDGVPK